MVTIAIIIQAIAMYSVIALLSAKKEEQQNLLPQQAKTPNVDYSNQRYRQRHTHSSWV